MQNKLVSLDMSLKNPLRACMQSEQETHWTVTDELIFIIFHGF